MNRLPPHDEAALDWYFGPGQTLLERSTMGGMLERARLFATDFLPDPELDTARRIWARDEPWAEPPGALTARPRGGGHQASGYTPEEGLLSRFARVSRIMQQLAARDVDAAGALVLYYGDQGVRWGRTRLGRIFALMPFTVSGKELLQRERRRTKGIDLGLSHAEELSNVLEVDRVQPVAARRALAEKARREALSVYEHAAVMWVEVKGGMRS